MATITGGGGGGAAAIGESWIGGGGICASMPVSSYATPEITGRIRVAPVRSGGRVASSRDARNAGDGSANANAATASGSLGRAVNPAGSITRASAANSAHEVLAFRKSWGMPFGFQSSAGASGPHPASFVPRSQYTSPGLKIVLLPGAQNQPRSAV